MTCRPFSFRSLAAVATTADSAAASMSYRPYFRGGRSQFGRGYCDRPVGPGNGDRQEFIYGDSHFIAVRDANREFRPSYNAVPPPPQYYPAQPVYRPGPQFQRAGPPLLQAELHRGPRPFNGPPQRGQIPGNYQRFRPQQMSQQVRPRMTKPPDYREWEYRKLELSPHCERFTVLSYNILADYLATDHWQQLYFHIPGYLMDWNWRKKNIIFELGLWSADILCLQEVDRFQDIEAELKPCGYNGIWKMRTGNPVDGCAIFWRVSRFKLVHEESIEYNKFGLRDNVAQICVFESLNGQNNSSGGSTLSTSSASSNRVVVCNIHVLFNPRRGEIKLGQIRILLERANAVSKLWDDAPVVLCGDFNCTPKSPLYNFIKEKELDLSELSRDKVSGQAGAELHPQRPVYPEYRGGGANNFTSPPVDSEKVEQGDLCLDAQKSARPQLSTNAPSAGSYSQPGSSVIVENAAPGFTEEHISRHANDLPNHDVVDIQTPTLSGKGTDNGIEHQCSSGNHSEDLPKASSEFEEHSESSGDDSLLKHAEVETSNLSASCKSTSSDTVLDKKFEGLSLDEIFNDATRGAPEDRESLLSELHSAGPGPSSTDTTSGFSNQKVTTGATWGYYPYRPAAWTPAEIEIASGRADCKVMEHPLKLTSAYAEVESPSGLRDSSGEPFVTSYNKRFFGTVDYIWHSQGLETAKVLAPIAKHVMHQSRGFPTKKWGSDHIALVSEFVFTKDIFSETPKE